MMRKVLGCRRPNLFSYRRILLYLLHGFVRIKMTCESVL